MFNRIKAVFGDGSAEESGSFPFTLTAANTTNATLIKAGAGVITSIHCINVSASIRYLRLYDSNQVPTAGAGTPRRKYCIPGNSSGAGFVLQPTVPMRFLTGLGFTITANPADSDATAVAANDVILTVEYI